MDRKKFANKNDTLFWQEFLILQITRMINLDVKKMRSSV